MGQYFLPIIFTYEGGQLKILAWIPAHSYLQGHKLMEHSYVGNNFVGAVERLLIPGGLCHNQRVVWAGDCADNESEGSNLQSIAEEKFPASKARPAPMANVFPYIVNHSKHQYVKKPEESDWAVHPLPLLTAEGNGRGGGDYHGPNMNKVGIWARDIISVEKEPLADYIELKVVFGEGA